MRLRLGGRFSSLPVGFGAVFISGSDHHASPRRSGCPHGTRLRTAHYFSIRNLRLSKNFPPFGRRVADAHCAQIKINVDYHDDDDDSLDPPVNFEVSQY